MTAFFTSDLHFLHKRITELTQRGLFTTPEKHTDWVIDIWNSQVKPNDTVWHLGDFCFNTKQAVVEEILEQLNGTKHFILGNHDSSKVMNKAVENGWLASAQHYKEITIGETKVCMMHYPIAVWNKQHYGSFMLHGHSHGNYIAPHGGKILDVGLDSAFNIFRKHRFFTEDDIVKIMANRSIVSMDHHSVKD